ncbi:MAG: SelT/SelW/SelH family protein [Nitrospinota bacterium]|nr:MAG: SelT/SelW/SelH family protein [Nitrospinota bacterium]
MSKDILETFGQALTSLTLVPSSGGRFEISLNKELVYSKLETGQFPEHKEIIDKIRERL